MAFDYVFQGAPSSVSAPAATVCEGLDSVNGVGYYSSPSSSGWRVVTQNVAKALAKGQTANNSNVLTYAVPVTGTYQVSLYEVSTNVPTAATLPAVTVTYTDNQSNTAVTDTLADVTGVGAKGIVNEGSFLVDVAAGGNIVVATASYAAGSDGSNPLAYAIKALISFVG